MMHTIRSSHEKHIERKKLARLRKSFATFALLGLLEKQNIILMVTLLCMRKGLKGDKCDLLGNKYESIEKEDMYD